MPQALNIDRKLFCALVLQGFTATQVANKLGMNTNTALTWIKRFGLQATKAKVKAELEQAGKQELAVAVADNEAHRARKLIGKSIHRDVQFLKDAKASQTDAQAFKRYSRLAPVLSAAEKVYGWRSDDAPPAHISFARVEMRVHQEPEAIDVESSPVTQTDTNQQEQPKEQA